MHSSHLRRPGLSWLATLLLMFSLSSEWLTAADSNQEDAWSTDAAAASRQAKDEGKDMLLLFTGSDWCPPCIQLEKNILSQDAFLEAVQEKFILVMFDFPQETPISDELQAQNNDWSDRYGIDAFPTLVLVDSEGQPYAFTGFREEGPTPT